MQTDDMSSSDSIIDSSLRTDTAPTAKHSQPLATDDADTTRDREPSYHIPVQTFSNLLAELLLDQNSNLASLAQQCIVSVAFQLSSISNGEASPSDNSISPALAQQLLDVEIFDGIILGLLSVAGRGKASSSTDSNNGDSASQSNVGSPDSQGIANPQKAVFQMNDDVDQGEINLAKMVSLSVCIVEIDCPMRTCCSTILLSSSLHLSHPPLAKSDA